MFDYRSGWLITTAILLGCGSSNTPLRAIDGAQALDDQMAVDSSCARNAIDANQAATLFRKHVMQVQPGMNPSAVFTATELAVPGLWDTLQAQVWNGKIRGEDGGYVRDCSFLYGNCALSFTDSADCSSGGNAIISGLLAAGAFYYSWTTGSGISYSLLGKLAPAGNTWLRTESMRYISRGLVVAPGEGKILVYQATSYWEKFNDWLDPELLGTLKDFGDHLGILDSSGNDLKVGRYPLR